MKFKGFSFIIIMLLLNSCDTNSRKNNETNKTQPNDVAQISTVDTSSKNIHKMIEYEVIKKYPHDGNAYTQGLFFYEGYLYESTGLYGKSSLRKVRIVDGQVLKQINLAPIYFAEGIALLNQKIYQLTWESHKGFIYNMDFDKIGEFSYPGEGWGITTDGTYLIISDGSNYLNFYEPASMNIVKTLLVEDGNTPIFNLNELEWIDGLIYANVYMRDEIVAINPDNGKVVKIIDISTLRAELDNHDDAEVSNGIAYNPKTNTLYLTGKNWSNLFEIKLKK